LGVTQQLPEEDQYNYPRAYLLARIRVMLGGRGSEEVVLGDVTTGAENDLVEASRLARRMITRWGMGELGLMTLESDQEQPFLGYELAQAQSFSDETAARIDRNVQNLLAEQHEIVRDLLAEHRTMLDRLASQLLEQETLDADQLESILGPRVGPKTRHTREEQPTPEPTPELAR
jgi:cell division protease FtsH